MRKGDRSQTIQGDLQETEHRDVMTLPNLRGPGTPSLLPLYKTAIRSLVSFLFPPEQPLV